MQLHKCCWTLSLSVWLYGIQFHTDAANSQTRPVYEIYFWIALTPAATVKRLFYVSAFAVSSV